MSKLNMSVIIPLFDDFLGNKNLKFKSTIIGGAALNILRITDRYTIDVDCLDPKISLEIKEASIEFQKNFPELELVPDWLNNGPDTLVRDLPLGWESRTVSAYTGKNIILTTLSRSDLLKTKLFAYCDRGSPDFEDLLLMKPSRQELSDCISWVKERDTNPNWPDNVQKRFLTLIEELYG